jgi:hypothetical protein
MKEVNVVQVFNAKTVVKNTAETSVEIDLNTFKPDGDFSLQIEVTGDGTAKVEYQVSNNGTNFYTPEGASAIFTSFTKTSGTTGKAIDGFAPELGRHIRFLATETGTSDDIVISAWLAMR